MRLASTTTALIPALLLLAAGTAAAETCYTVVDKANRTVYQSQDTPIDLAYHVGDKLYARYPSATVLVIWDAKGNCFEQRDTERIATVMRTARADRE